MTTKKLYDPLLHGDGSETYPKLGDEWTINGEKYINASSELYYADDNITVINGDCRTTLRQLPKQSVNCCVTSPPYFGLRDYGVEGQIGLEETPDGFVKELVEVFREVRRVLRDDGTLWLNLGDSYAGTGKTGGGEQGKRTGAGAAGASSPNGKGTWWSPKGTGLKIKDLIGIPWRVAFALQADGWYLRQDIIWHKPNPMPESVRDRCTKCHEYIFLLAKSEKYYFDPIKEPATYAGQMRGGSKNRYEQNDAGMDCKVYDTRNKRSVWTVQPAKYKAAHFATFPPDLIEPCILAGCPEGGTVLDPFAGSGTTLDVAQKHNRKSIGIELNQSYCGLILERIGAF